MNADKLLFRASQVGKIMTDAKKGVTGLGETCKKNLIEIFIQEKYGRVKDITNRYTVKGLAVEEVSITLFSLASNKMYKKNEDHLSNKFIKGTPDLYEGKDIKSATRIIDVKSSWDIFTFFNAQHELNKMYYWQLQAYMALTGANEATLAYCLANTPDTMIADAKRKLGWSMGIIDDTEKDFMAACDEIDRLSVYDDIPLSDRVIQINVQRNNADIQKMYDRVQDCRAYMNEKLFQVVPSRELVEQTA